MDKPCILIAANNSGGLYHFRLELIKRLLSDGYDVVISVPDDKFLNEFKDLGCRSTAAPIERHGTNPIKDLKLLFYYYRLLGELSPHTVLSYTIKPNIYAGLACRLRKIPYICNITGLGIGMQKKTVKNIIISLYKHSVKSAKCLFFQNKVNMDIFENLGIRAKKERLIPGSGVNLEYHSKKEYPPDDGKIKFLFIGRIMRDKGIDELLYAAKKIRGEFPFTEFHIVGSAEEIKYKQILEDYEKEGIIIYHGSLADVRPMIEECNCTVLPSYHEGMANVLLESAAAARPVIASDVPGCRETLEDGVSGFLCRAKDADDLISKIKNFIGLSYEQKREFGLSGRQKVEKEFDRNIVVNAYIEEINYDKGVNKYGFCE